MDEMDTILMRVQCLKAGYHTPGGFVKAVDDISFDLRKKEVLGIVGESGCGKSTTGLSLIRLLPPKGKILGGKVFLDGENILKKTESEMRKVRSRRISMIFQGAMNTLNPLMKIGKQIEEVILTQERVTKSEANKRAKELLGMVGIDVSRYCSHPHELSGGMKQRVMTSIALACHPDIVIADEPTTALDVIVKAQILNLLRRLQRDLGLSFILISHDLSSISQVADSVIIMYAGKITEIADIDSFLRSPIHPYSEALINAFIPLKGEIRKVVSLEGAPPNLILPPPGCNFHPRCPFAKNICKREAPELIEIRKGHYVACHFD